MAAVDSVLVTISTQILTIAAPDTPVVSEATYDELREPGRSPRHLEFALGLGSSQPLDSLGRQRVAANCPTRHALRVGTYYQYPSKDRAAGYRSAVAQGERIRQVLTTQSTWHGDARLTWRSTTRLPGPSGWTFIDLAFDLDHTDPLS